MATGKELGRVEEENQDDCSQRWKDFFSEKNLLSFLGIILLIFILTIILLLAITALDNWREGRNSSKPSRKKKNVFAYL